MMKGVMVMDNNLLELMTYPFLILILTFTFSIIPYVIRKSLSFGVRIPESEFDNIEVRKIRKNYKRIIFISGVSFSIIITLFIYISKNEMELFIELLFYSFFLVQSIVYLISHFNMKKLKEKSDWKVNKESRITIDVNFRQKKIAVSKLWFLLYVVIILLTLITTILVYDKFEGNLANFSDLGSWISNNRSVLYIPISQIFILITMYFSYLIIMKSKQELDNKAPKKSAKNHARYRYVMTKFIVIFGLIIELMFLINQLYIVNILKNDMWITIVPLIISLVTLLTLTFIVFKVGQGGWKLNRNSNISNNEIDKDDDKHWKLGIVYFNPHDSAIFVEKRFGVGWTFNMARVTSWIIIIVLIIGIIGLYKVFD